MGASLNTIKSWKRRDGWDQDEKAIPRQKKVAQKDATKSATKGATAKKLQPGATAKPVKKMGPPKGNRNAVYGGAPRGNHNGLSTGEHVRIDYDMLTSDEQEVVRKVALGVDYTGLTSMNLALLIVREQRMMRMIDDLRQRSERGMILDESVQGSNTAGAGQNTARSTHQSATVRPVEDRILHIEEALTRVQQAKQKILDALRDFALRDDQMEMEKGRYHREFAAPGENDTSLTIIYDYGDGDSE